MGAAKKRLRVLLVFDIPYSVARDHDYSKEFSDKEHWYVENDVHEALLENRYEVRRLGLFNDVRPLLAEVVKSTLAPRAGHTIVTAVATSLRRQTYPKRRRRNHSAPSSATSATR